MFTVFNPIHLAFLKHNSWLNKNLKKITSGFELYFWFCNKAFQNIDVNNDYIFNYCIFQSFAS